MKKIQRNELRWSAAGWIITLPRSTVTFLMSIVIKTGTRHSRCRKYLALAKSFQNEFSPKLSLKQKIVILYLWVIFLQGIHPCPLKYTTSSSLPCFQIDILQHQLRVYNIRLTKYNMHLWHETPRNFSYASSFTRQFLMCWKLLSSFFPLVECVTIHGDDFNFIFIFTETK